MKREGEMVAVGAMLRTMAGGLPVMTEAEREAARADLDRLEAEERRAESARKAAERVQWLRKRSGVPARFAGATIEAFEARTASIGRARTAVVEYLDGFDEIRKTGRSMIFVGPAGTGKTMLGCAAVLALCDRWMRAGYVKVGDMIRRIRGSWRGEGGETEVDVLAELRSLDLLVIDEIGVQYGTEAEAIHLFDVIDGRYDDMRPTIVITNCKPEELASFLGDRVLDRLRDNGGRLVKFEGSSARAGR